MGYEFIPGKQYRMPTHFGPSLGPRQGPDGRTYANVGSFKTTSLAVSFLSDRKQLENLLPKGFVVGAEPIVTVEASYFTELEWLAGRGYNTLGVRWPAVFKGKVDEVKGTFLSILWENLADPIITGREDLGFSKIYCELPEPMVMAGQAHCIASWLGFKFMDLKVRNLKELGAVEVAAMAKKPGDPTLHYKYMPRTGEWGKADVTYATMTPAEVPNRVFKEAWVGDGEVEFHEAAWEDLPTFFNIVNVFRSLRKEKYLKATMVKTVGYKDLSDQRILR